MAVRHFVSGEVSIEMPNDSARTFKWAEAIARPSASPPQSTDSFVASLWIAPVAYLALAVFLGFVLWRYRRLFGIFRRGLATAQDQAPAASFAAAPDSRAGYATAQARQPEAPPRIYREFRRFGLDRLWLEFQLLGLVGMAVAFSSALAVASFFTTFKGLQNFTNGIVPLLAAVGIQGTLYIASWHVANGSALYLNGIRRRRKRREDEDDASEGSVIGSLFRPIGAFLGYVFTQPFSVLLLVVPMVISVFFSFDALFDVVYTEEARLLTNKKVARSDISAVFSDIVNKIREERTKGAKDLTESDKWTKDFSPRLEKILKAAADSKGIIEQAALQQRAELEIRLRQAGEAVLSKQNEIAVIEGKLKSLPIGSDGPNAQGDATGEIASATERVKELEGTVGDLSKQLGDRQAALAEEQKAGGIDKKTGKRRVKGCGSVCHEIQTEVDALKANLDERRGELSRARQKLEEIRRNGQVGATTRQRLKNDLEQKKVELVPLQANLAAIQAQFGSLSGGSTSKESGASGIMIANVDQARTVFAGTGSKASFKTMVDGCNKLLQLLQANPTTQKTVMGLSCDTSALSGPVDALAVLDEALAKAEKICTVDEKFNDAGTVDLLVRRGRECVQAAGLPSGATFVQRDTIDRVEQENSPKTSHFERTTSSLRRGDILAWLALAIAMGVDLLVFVTAILGARVLASPLISSGLVASKAELEETDTSSYYDPVIYPDDPTDIINLKIFLSMVAPEADEDEENNDVVSVVDTGRVPPEHRSRVYAFINDAATSDPPRARALRGRPGVFRMENSLVKHFKRTVSLYEKKRQKLDGRRDPATGKSVGLDGGPGGGGGAGGNGNNGNKDPRPKRARFASFEADGGWDDEPVEAANDVEKSAQPSAASPGRRSGWKGRGSHPDAKSY